MFVLLAALIFLPELLSYYSRRIIILSMIFIMLTISLNVVTGYAGQTSLGQSAFYTIGAYASALLTTKLGLSFWFAILLAAAIATVCGVIVGLPSFRAKGIYLAIITLMFAFIVFLLALNLKTVTGGASGIRNIPRPTIGEFIFTQDDHYYYLVLFFAILTVASAYRLGNSSLGRALKAIQSNETAASTLGLNVRRYKLFAFATAAFYAGVAGSLYAHFARFISTEAFQPTLSILILIMLIVGGMGRIDGAVVGALVVYILPEFLRFAREYWNIAFGLLLILILLFMPGGLVSIPERLRLRIRNYFQRKTSPDSETEDPLQEHSLASDDSQ